MGSQSANLFYPAAEYGSVHNMETVVGPGIQVGSLTLTYHAYVLH